MLANTPKPPYYAVIFSNIRTNADQTGYEKMADKMVKLASQQPGFLGFESARQEIGITVSYWKDLESIKNWKANSEHLAAQKYGIKDWYAHYITRIAKVERDYAFTRPQ
ncbi:antibiotic biosynthesis monooxygenase family protein [Marinoscillum sp.]|uniref:antibiotic biosynthesis monooxygenase family protein n=1 Tax=Marinoscillum sp. TaxID=2024838 RepID=UPI003BAD7FFD